RLDDREAVAALHGAARLREVDEHELAHSLLRVIGDADARGAVGQRLDPLVTLGISAIAGNVAHVLSPSLLLSAARLRARLALRRYARTAASRPRPSGACRVSRPRP